MSKRNATDLPLWQLRIASAVEKHGQLKAIADAAGMTSPQLQKIANGKNPNPGVRTLERVALAMGTTLPELMTIPRPEETSGHGRQGSERSPILDAWLARIDEEAPAEDSVRGDILKALAALARALRREGNPGTAPASTSTAGR